MKQYKIPVAYEMYGYVYVMAESLDEACEKAESDDIPLPYTAEYIEGSWQVDWEGAQMFNS